MGLRQFLLPVVALIGSAVWLGVQEAGLGELRGKISVLRERVLKYEALPVDEGVRGALARERKSGKARFETEEGELDWLKIGKMVGESHRGNGIPQDLRAYIDLQGVLMDLNEEELVEAMKLVRTDEQYAEVRPLLEGALSSLLVEKDPEEFLAGMEDQLNSPQGESSWNIQRAFQLWLKEDPAAALGWLDEKREAGAFDARTLDPSRSLDRQLEVRALGELMSSAPGEIRKRLAALGEGEARELLKESHFWVKGDVGLRAYAELVREEIGGRGGAMALGKALVNQAQDDFEAVSQKMGLLDLSGDEKRAVMEGMRDQFARPWDRKVGDLRKFHEWVKREDAASAVELAGEAYGRYAGFGNTDFAEVLREVKSLSEAEGEPEMLRYFAESIRRPEQVMGQIKDEALKVEVQAMLDAVKKEGSE